MRAKKLFRRVRELFSENLRNGSPDHTSKEGSFSKHETERQVTVKRGDAGTKMAELCLSHIAGGRTGNWVM